MKKFLVVLTILVLVAGFAFAESNITGTVNAEYKFDFDAKTVDYAVTGTNAKLEWTWNSHTVGPYEAAGKPYATVTVALEMKTTVEEDLADDWTFANSYKATQDDFFDTVAVTLTLKEAKIVGEEWSIDLLKATMYGEYAASAWDYTIKGTGKSIAKDKAYTFDNRAGAGKVNGITVTYKDYSVGIGVDKNADDSFEIVVSSESPAFKFEGGSAQIAAELAVRKAAAGDAKFAIAASAKADYAVDKLTAKAAFDTLLVDSDFDFDTALQVAYEPATLDFYYGSTLTTPAIVGGLFEKYMSIRVSVDVAKVAENVPVTAYVGMKDVLDKNAGRELLAGAEYVTEAYEAEASVVYGLENKEIIVGGTGKALKLIEGFGFEAGVVYAKIENSKAAAAQVGVNYTAPEDKYEASADIVLARWTGSKEIKVGFVAEASTSKIVENAKLYCEFAIDGNGAVFAYDLYTLMRKLSTDSAASTALKGLGKYFTVGCEIAF